jgi:hypothetical protein
MGAGTSAGTQFFVPGNKSQNQLFTFEVRILFAHQFQKFRQRCAAPGVRRVLFEPLTDKSRFDNWRSQFDRPQADPKGEARSVE